MPLVARSTSFYGMSESVAGFCTERSVLRTVRTKGRIEVSNNTKDKFKVRTNRKGLALKGYDPLAYFTLGEATKGSPDISYRWSDAEWLFATTEHRDLFINNPTSYAPQFGGSCAVASATGHNIVSGSPKHWRIENGHLYVNRDPLASALHKPLTKRIHRLSAKVRADQGIETAAAEPIAA